MDWFNPMDFIKDNFQSFFGNPSQAWDRFRNGRSNEINEEIAEENLDYQRERNEIEDARYEDETAYNRAFEEDERAYQRAFAEDERAYNRALQQTLFEREDTALERQAQSLSKMGINPLGQNMNGLGAGQALSASTPGTSAAPTTSSRGGSPLHNDFKAIPGGIEGVLSSLSGLASTVNGVATGQYQRDALALENDRKYLENIKIAHDLGLDYDYITTGKKRDTSTTHGEWKNGSLYTTFYDGVGSTPDYLSSKGNYFREEDDKKRQLEGKKTSGVFDWESPQTKLIKSLGTLDFQSVAENLLTNIADAGNWVNGNLKNFSKDMENNAIMNFIKKFFAF